MSDDLKGENQELKKKIQSLHGQLGVQGRSINLEARVASIQKELDNAYELLEKAELDKRTLRDEFAMRAMQGIHTNNKSLVSARNFHKPNGVLSVAKCAYEMADAMMKKREK